MQQSSSFQIGDPLSITGSKVTLSSERGASTFPPAPTEPCLTASSNHTHRIEHGPGDFVRVKNDLLVSASSSDPRPWPAQPKGGVSDVTKASHIPILSISRYTADQSPSSQAVRNRNAISKRCISSIPMHRRVRRTSALQKGTTMWQNLAVQEADVGPGPGEERRKRKVIAVGQARILQSQVDRQAPTSKKTKDKKEGVWRSSRSRNICRKYWLLWCKHVWGRVLPSVARQHYASRRTKQVLEAWHTLWWVEHRVWKLQIRAECHNRYRLWVKVWQAWTAYVLAARVKFAQGQQGKKMRCTRLKAWAWAGWRRYVEAQRREREWIASAEQWHRGNVKKGAWLQWKAVFGERVQEKSAAEFSLYYWASQLEKKVWLQWKSHYNQRRLLSFKMAAARAHHHKTCKQDALEKWFCYIQVRRRKHHMTRIAMEAHTHALRVRVWSHWHGRILQVQELVMFEEKVASRGRCVRCRRILLHWKFYVALRRHNAHLHQLASLHLALTLKSVALLGFTRYHQLQRTKSCYKQLANTHYISSRLRRCWMSWLQRCEHNEEILLGPRSRQARYHASHVMMRKCMASWLVYVRHCRYRKRLKFLADGHFMAVALPKYFSLFQEYSNISVCKKKLKYSSEIFRRETLLSMVFYKWWRESQLRQDVRMLERVALLHWEERTKQCLLQLWWKCAQSKLALHQLEEVADGHCTAVLMGRVFSKWKVRWRWRVRTARGHQEALQLFSFKLMGRMWAAWSQLVCQKRVACRKKGVAMGCYHRLLLNKALRAWKSYHEHACAKRCQIARVVAVHEASLRRGALHMWRSTAVQLREERTQHQRARAHYSSCSMAKVIMCWRELAVTERVHREQEDRQVEEAKSRLSLARACRILRRWREEVEEGQRERGCLCRADKHRYQKLKSKVLTAWLSRLHLTQRKKALSRKCDWFESSRLLGNCYSKWRLQLMHRLQEGQKCILSLWQWSHVLEQKVFAAWLAYTKEKRRKAERYAQAMCRHRHALVTLAVRQWITVASRWKAQREEDAFCLQTKHAERVLGCVKRCAQRWKQLARRHRPPPLLHPLLTSPPSTHTALQTSTTWISLVKELCLPDSGPVTRPAPRKLDLNSSEFLPHPLPPLPSHTYPYHHQHPMVGGDGEPIGNIEDQEIIGAHASCSSFLCATSIADPSLLPLPHTLDERRVKDRVLLMRKELRTLLNLKIHRKTLLQQLANTREEERVKVQSAVDGVEALIVEKEPTMREIATDIRNLLHMCS